MRFLCDVEKKGDEFINTGDLVMIGTDRSYYFVDRLGDTFRFVGQFAIPRVLLGASCNLQTNL